MLRRGCAGVAPAPVRGMCTDGGAVVDSAGGRCASERIACVLHAKCGSARSNGRARLRLHLRRDSGEALRQVALHMLLVRVPEAVQQALPQLLQALVRDAALPLEPADQSLQALVPGMEIATAKGAGKL